MFNISEKTVVVRSNITRIEDVLKKLDALSSARRSWEEGVYKKSNEELYNLLDRCLALYIELKGNRPLIMQLNAALKERGMIVQSNTALNTKIVRFVFGDCGKRLYTYARVLAVASAEKPEKLSMLRFITEAGGIEAIRKKAACGMTPAQKAAKHIEFAETAYSQGKALVTFAQSLAQLQPNFEEGRKFSVGLLRHEADGSVSIVDGSSNERILRALLADVGKRQVQAQDIATLEESVSETRAQRKRLLEAA